jgi:hypothetical protein
MSERRERADEFRFGGHQSFPLRIAWLPKATAAIKAGLDPLSDPLVGVVELGLGKNMVEALRCWIDAYGVARRLQTGGWELTALGEGLFGDSGFDPFLEDEQTLWLLHWLISTLDRSPFFAWELLINRWNEPTFTAAGAVAAFGREADSNGRKLSEVSARQHFDVWLHTYLSTRTRAMEDGLDSPLASLGLIRLMGERESANGRSEPVYGFDLSPKRPIGQALFRYCLADWWARSYRDEETIPFWEVVLGRMSPGRVFRMPEAEVRERLIALSAQPSSGFELLESLNQYVVRRRSKASLTPNLSSIYARGRSPARRVHADA